jgi:hypothetical protein
MNNTISGKEVLKQLKADLIGKDSYRGVTLTYSWLANQFGHIALGFIPTFILYIIFSKHSTNHSPAIRSAIIISICWLSFETYNFLGPLLSKKHSLSKLLFVPGKKYTFQPAWGNIAFDTLTDLCFFWFGAFAASILCVYSNTALIVLIVLLVLLMYPCYYWYLTKMYLQIPQYPYQFRLSQWDVVKIKKDDVERISTFLNNKQKGMHLFVFGSKRSGKTSISVGIATELSIKHNACVYTTAMKLYSMFFEPDEKLLTIKGNLWTWRRSSVLVIDDINPGDPIKDIVSPECFLHFLDTLSRNDVNREVIKSTNIIWVLGNEDPKKELLQKWQHMLEEIGVDKAHILSINLPPNYLS